MNSPTPSVRDSGEPADNDSTVPQHGSQASDDGSAQYGSSSEDGNGHRARAFEITSEDERQAWSAQEEEQPVGPDTLAARHPLTAAALRIGQSSMRSAALAHNTGRSAQTSARREFVPPRRVSSIGAPRHSARSTSHSGPSPSSSTASRAPYSRSPLRREGAFYGLPESSASGSSACAAPQAPRRRGQLRREPVYIEGQDPSEVTDASELRGADPRTMRANRYWLEEEWGPIPTLEEMFPDSEEEINAATVVDWITWRYGRGTDAYIQAVNFLFPLPNGEEPRFLDIVPTGEWRRQGDDWQGGIEPVDRVRGPARADDAADSQADSESIGYISDESMALDDSQPGPSSMALVLASRAATSSSFRASHGSSRPSSSSSGSAGPFTAGQPRQRKRTRESDSDLEHSTTSSPDEERHRARRRLDPPSLPAAAGPSSANRHRLASRNRWLAPRNASFAVPAQFSRPRRNAGTQTSPPPPALRDPVPPPSGGLQAPQIVVTPPSPDAEGTSGAQAGPSGAAAGPSTASRPSSSALLAPPSPLARPRRSHSRPTGPSPFGTPPPPRGVSSQMNAAASSSNGAARIPPRASLPPGRPQPAVPTGLASRLRPRKRARDEAGDDKDAGGSNDENNKKKRRER
ncbi:hypothetical protein BV20DRAFT_541867 [Pilatotrama ljubarskyi]|nr:hypothetical protein BV20DRAFT_541867 [Pilatotrama ljubarskyi]